MMTDNEEPAQWAMDRARELIRAEYLARGASVVAAAAISHPPANPAVKVLARIIEEHDEKYETPPVDPDLEIAREAAALAYEEQSRHGLAAQTLRVGIFDNGECVASARHALRIARERGVL
jgi:hypothetical protein